MDNKQYESVVPGLILPLVILDFGAMEGERLSLNTSSLLLTRISRIKCYVPEIGSISSHLTPKRYSEYI